MIHRRYALAAGAVAPFIRVGRARADTVVPQARPDTTVRFGSVGGLTDAGLYLADDQGYFTAAGVAVRMLRMPNAPTLLTALATGQLDVAGISVTPGLFSSIAQGVQIRIVGDKQSVRPGFSATRLVIRAAVPPGPEAQQVAALKGRPIAISSKAASVAMVLRNYLAGFGMTPADVRVVELSYPSMVPALGSGAVDAAIVLEPFLSEALRMGIARQLSDVVAASGGTAAEGTTSVPLVYSEVFARGKTAAQGFMDAYLRGVRLYNDAFQRGIGKDKVIGILAARAKLDAAVIRDAFPAGLDPNGKVNVPFLEQCETFFIQQRYLQAPVDLGQLVDPSFADSTVARFGKYQIG